MDFSEFGNDDIDTLREYLLRGKNRLKLIIYRRVLYEKENIPCCPELNELIRYGLIREYGEKYEVYNKIYRKKISKSWVEENLITKTIKDQISIYAQNDKSLEKLLLEVAFNHPHAYISGEQEEKVWVDSLIEKYFIDNWHNINQEEHEETYLKKTKKNICTFLKGIEQKVLKSDYQKQLLEFYQKVINGDKIKADNQNKIFDLLQELNLVIKNDNHYLEPHYVYQYLFNENWCNEKQQFIESSDLTTKKLSLRVNILFFISLALGCIFLIIFWINIKPVAEKSALDALGELNDANNKNAQALSLKSNFELKEEIQNNSNKNDFSKYSTVVPIYVSGKIKNEIYAREIVDNFNVSIRAVKFNYDGSKIAIGGEKRQLFVYTFSDNNQKKISGFLQPNNGEIKHTVSSLDFYPNDSINLLAVADKHIVKIFQVNEENITLLDMGIDFDEEHNEEIYKIKFSKNGNFLITIDRNQNLKLWNFNVSSKKISLNASLGNIQNVKSATFSPKFDDILVVATSYNDASKNSIIEYNLNRSGSNIRKKTFIPNIELTSMNFSYDGKYLATTENNKVFIRLSSNLETRYECFKDNDKCIQGVSNIYFTSWKTLGRYTLIAENANETITAINLKNKPNSTKKKYSLKKINKHKKWNIEALDLNPNREYIVTGERYKKYNKIILWDLNSLVAKESKIINIGEKSKLKRSDIFINQLYDYITKLIVNENGRFKILDFESGINNTNNLNQRFNNFPSNIIGLTVLQSPDIPDRDRLAIVTKGQNKDKSLVLCSLLTYRCDDRYDLSVLGEIKFIKSNLNNNRIVVVDVQNKGYFLNLDDSSYQILENIIDVDISHNGLMVATRESSNRSILYNWNSKSIAVNKTLGKDVKQAIFSPQGKYIAVNENEKLEIRLNTSTDESIESYATILKELSKDLSNVSIFAFSPDEKYLAIVKGDKNNIVKIKNLSNQNVDSIRLENNNNNVEKLIFSPELSINVYKKNTAANLIATVESDGKIRLWDLNGRLISELDTFEKKVIHLQFSPKQKLIDDDGSKNELIKYLIAIVEDVDEEGSVYRQIWDINEELNLQKHISRACKWHDSNFLDKDYKKEHKLEKLESLCKQEEKSN